MKGPSRGSSHVTPLECAAGSPHVSAPGPGSCGACGREGGRSGRVSEACVSTGAASVHLKSAGTFHFLQTSTKPPVSDRRARVILSVRPGRGRGDAMSLGCGHSGGRPARPGEQRGRRGICARSGATGSSSAGRRRLGPACRSASVAKAGAESLRPQQAGNPKG